MDAQKIDQYTFLHFSVLHFQSTRADTDTDNDCVVMVSVRWKTTDRTLRRQ